ncbi:MAG: ATPase [Chloroflexota bacterium]|nr:ATPase [Chloroflexota bacterium]MDQ5865093.1 ATPase [Chloroflexota bacterium]
MPKFVFRRNQHIGAAGAEQDDYYLSKCFVDTGVLNILRDCDDPRRILIGRTGSGKSALLTRLTEAEEHVIPIIPEALSLAYISNSTILNFFAEAGVDLDLFYRWLWRHVFCVEVLRAKFPADERKRSGLLNLIYEVLPKSKRSEAAVKYLKDWGDSFWQETEVIITEATRKVESSLQGAVEGKVAGIASLSGAAAQKLTEEQKQEIANRAREVVSRVQIRELGEVLDTLDEVLQGNKQQRYFITIDKLDEEWAEDKIRVRLIKALLQASLDFARVKNVKVIIALRSDLIDRVYRLTRSSGFQEEKFRTNSIDLRWSKEHLTAVLDRRIHVLVRDQYSNATVTHSDLLPAVVTLGKSRRRKLSGLDYMIERTLCRPRDIIHFFNACIERSEGKPSITVQALQQAEGYYSRDRFRALLDEWYGSYPNLATYAQILKNRPDSFRVDDITLEEISELCLRLATDVEVVNASDMEMIQHTAEGTISASLYRRHLVQILYKVGLVGLRIEPGMPISWSYEGGPSVSDAEIHDDTRLYVQPTFWRCFGITDRTIQAA